MSTIHWGPTTCPKQHCPHLVKCLSVYCGGRSAVSDFVTPWTAARQAPLSLWFSRQNTGEDNHSHLQGIFPTQVCCSAGRSLPAEPPGKPAKLPGRSQGDHSLCFRAVYTDVFRHRGRLGRQEPCSPEAYPWLLWVWPDSEDGSLAPSQDCPWLLGLHPGDFWRSLTAHRGSYHPPPHWPQRWLCSWKASFSWESLWEPPAWL